MHDFFVFLVYGCAQDIGEVVRENDVAHRRIKKLELDLGGAEKRFQSLQADLTGIEESRDAVSAALQKQLLLTKHAEEARDVLQKEVQSAAADHKTKDESARLVRAEAMRLEAMVNKLTEDLNEMAKQNTKNESLVAAKTREKELALQVERSEASRQEEALKQEISRALKETERTQDKLKDANKQAGSATATAAAAAEELARVRQELRQELHVAQQDAAGKAKEIILLRKEHVGSEKRMAELEQAEAELSLALRNVTDERQIWQGYLAERDAAVEARKHAETELEEATNKASHTAEQFALLQKSAAKAETLFAEEQAHLKSQLIDARQWTNELQDKYDKTLEQLAEAATKQLDTKKILQGKESTQQAISAAHVAESERQHRAFDERLARAKVEIAQATNDAVAAKLDAARSASEVQELRSKMDMLQQEMQGTKMKLSQEIGRKVDLQFQGAVVAHQRLKPEAELEQSKFQMSSMENELNERKLELRDEQAKNQEQAAEILRLQRFISDDKVELPVSDAPYLNVG
eukprot:SAG31_NODE_183_length_20987_cov_8.711078_1_plen_523_part_10